jgi:hypothetical protein
VLLRVLRGETRTLSALQRYEPKRDILFLPTSKTRLSTLRPSTIERSRGAFLISGIFSTKLIRPSSVRLLVSRTSPNKVV